MASYLKHAGVIEGKDGQLRWRGPVSDYEKGRVKELAQAQGDAVRNCVKKIQGKEVDTDVVMAD